MVSSPPPELLPPPPEPLLPDSPHAARAVSRTVAPVSAVAILRFIRISPEVGLGARRAGTGSPGGGCRPGRVGSARGRRGGGGGLAGGRRLAGDLGDRRRSAVAAGVAAGEPPGDAGGDGQPLEQRENQVDEQGQRGDQ